MIKYQPQYKHYLILIILFHMLFVLYNLPFVVATLFKMRMTNRNFFVNAISNLPDFADRQPGLKARSLQAHLL